MSLIRFMRLSAALALSLSVPLSLAVAGLLALVGDVTLILDVYLSALDGFYVLLALPLLTLLAVVVCAPVALPLFNRLYRNT